MKIVHLLGGTLPIMEGMIKLPPKLLGKLTEAIHIVCLSYLHAKLKKAAKVYCEPDVAKAAVKKFEDFIKQRYKVKVQVVDLKDHTWDFNVGDVSSRDLDPAYRKLVKLQGAEFEFDPSRTGPLSLLMHLAPSHLEGNRGQYDANENRIELNMTTVRTWTWEKYCEYVTKSLDPDEDQGKAAKIANELLERLADRIQRIEGILKHELTHYMQFKVFARASMKQLDDNDVDAVPADADDRPRRYFTSQIEFDPLLKSAVEDFVTDYNRAKRKLKKDFDWKVWASVAVDEMSPEDAAQKLKMDIPHGAYSIFSHLKAENRDKYKRAVKRFMLELEKRLGPK